MPLAARLRLALASKATRDVRRETPGGPKSAYVQGVPRAEGDTDPHFGHRRSVGARGREPRAPPPPRLRVATYQRLGYIQRAPTAPVAFGAGQADREGDREGEPGGPTGRCGRTAAPGPRSRSPEATVTTRATAASLSSLMPRSSAFSLRFRLRACPWCLAGWIWLLGAGLGVWSGRAAEAARGAAGTAGVAVSPAAAANADRTAEDGVVLLEPTNDGRAPLGPLPSPQAAKEREPIFYPSDGLRITGLLSKPAGAGPFPLALINQGGFESAKSVGRLLDLFARLGYVAIAVDYRGVGRSEGRREMAKGEVDDVLNAIEYAATLPYVNAQRVVVWGFNHGGTIALLAAARTPAIKGVVTVGAPIELAECYRWWVARAKKQPAVKPLTGLPAVIGGTPEKAPQEWRVRSPLYVAGQIKCPVLLVQGGRDEALPADQAAKMQAALVAAGNARSELLVDRTAGHVLDGEALARNGRHMVEFLQRAIGKKTPATAAGAKAKKKAGAAGNRPAPASTPAPAP